jgi:hypothetical protein
MNEARRVQLAKYAIAFGSGMMLEGLIALWAISKYDKNNNELRGALQRSIEATEYMANSANVLGKAVQRFRDEADPALVSKIGEDLQFEAVIHEGMTPPWIADIMRENPDELRPDGD